MKYFKAQKKCEKNDIISFNMKKLENRKPKVRICFRGINKTHKGGKMI